MPWQRNSLLITTTQEHNDETEGRQGTWGAGIQGTPAIFLIIHLFLTPNVQEGGFSPRVAYRRDKRGETPSHHCFLPHRRDERGGTPSCHVSFHKDATWRGSPLPIVFSSTQTRHEGVLPLCVVFSSTQTRHEGVLPLCVVFSSTQTWREGENLFTLGFLPPRRD